MDKQKMLDETKEEILDGNKIKTQTLQRSDAFDNTDVTQLNGNGKNNLILSNLIFINQ